MVRKLSFIMKSSCYVAATMFLFSCGSNNTETATNTGDSTSVVTDQAETKAKNVFYAIPSPIELGQLMKRAGVTFKKELLNPVDNVSKYSSTASKALNMGIYGADLSYTTLSDQGQEPIQYLNAAKKLAQDLGISDAFTPEVMQRMEANKNNKDSLLHIISESFTASNQAMKENDRPAISLSTLTIAGGWIEIVYIATKAGNSAKNKENIVALIAEQKGTLNNLISLLDESGIENETNKSISADLKEIKGIYDENAAAPAAVKVTTDPNTKVVTIGGSSQYTLSADQFNRISQKIEAIRTKIVNL